MAAIDERLFMSATALVTLERTEEITAANWMGGTRVIVIHGIQVSEPLALDVAVLRAEQARRAIYDGLLAAVACAGDRS